MNGFQRLGREIAIEQDALRCRAVGAGGVRERLASLDLAAPRRWRRARLAFGTLAAAAAAALLAVLSGPLARREPLRLRVGASAEPASVGAFIAAPDGEPLPLRFSDGTRIEMAPRLRVRLEQLDASGAHLLLESGRAHVEAVHRASASWRLSMGPFAVRVTGTRFDVGWDAEADSFELVLEDGTVELSGCMFGQARPVSSGQTVRASCKLGQAVILDRQTAPPVGARAESPLLAPWTGGAATGAAAALEPSAAPVGTAAAAEPTPTLAAPPERAEGTAQGAAAAAKPTPTLAGRAGASRPVASEQSPKWLALAEQGKYEEALAAATAEGFEAQCAQSNADALAMLADAARYSGDDGKAVHALLALRQRFPQGKRAALAAFALGRLAFDAHGSFGRAADWFRTYLKEQPNGPLAREARGRWMEALHRAGDTAGARALAAQYLRDYPSGPHRDLAGEILGRAAP